MFKKPNKYLKCIYTIGGLILTIMGIIWLPKDIKDISVASKEWGILKDGLLSIIMEQILTNGYLIRGVLFTAWVSFTYWSLADNNKIKLFLKKERRWFWECIFDLFGQKLSKKRKKEINPATASIAQELPSGIMRKRRKKEYLPIFKEPSPLKIEFEKQGYCKEETSVIRDIKKYENIFWCDLYNSGDTYIEEVSVTLIHGGLEYLAKFYHQDKISIGLSQGQRAKVYLISYNSTLNPKKLYVKGARQHIDIRTDGWTDDKAFGFDNMFEIKVTAKEQPPQYRKFAIVASKDNDLKCEIRYIEPQFESSG